MRFRFLYWWRTSSSASLKFSPFSKTVRFNDVIIVIMCLLISYPPFYHRFSFCDLVPPCTKPVIVTLALQEESTCCFTAFVQLPLNCLGGTVSSYTIIYVQENGFDFHIDFRMLRQRRRQMMLLHFFYDYSLGNDNRCCNRFEHTKRLSFTHI